MRLCECAGCCGQHKRHGQCECGFQVPWHTVTPGAVRVPVRLKIEPSIGMAGLVKGPPCLIVLNTSWMRICENSVLSLRLGRRCVRLPGSAQAAKELLSGLPADMHHIGIIRDLAQNRCYRAQLLGIMIGPYVL